MVPQPLEFASFPDMDHGSVIPLLRPVLHSAPAWGSPSTEEKISADSSIKPALKIEMESLQLTEKLKLNRGSICKSRKEPLHVGCLSISLALFSRLCTEHWKMWKGSEVTVEHQEWGEGGSNLLNVSQGILRSFANDVIVNHDQLSVSTTIKPLTQSIHISPHLPFQIIIIILLEQTCLSKLFIFKFSLKESGVIHKP